MATKNTRQPTVSERVSRGGLFASPERQLMFDINDFDETLPGPSSQVTGPPAPVGVV